LIQLSGADDLAAFPAEPDRTPTPVFTNSSPPELGAHNSFLPSTGVDAHFLQLLELSDSSRATASTEPNSVLWTSLPRAMETDEAAGHLLPMWPTRRLRDFCELGSDADWNCRRPMAA